MPQRSLAAWVPSNVPALCLSIVKRALCDVGICEMPPGSNRSGRIDEYNRMAGAPEGSYWCASAVGAWWREAAEFLGQHIDLPKGYASCDNWMKWGKETKRWSDVPGYGASVLYGVPGDARHIGTIIRISPLVMSIEGNTTIEGARFSSSRNGVAVSQKEITKDDPVLGYVHPFPLQ